MTLIRLALGLLAVAALFVGVGWARGLRDRRSAVALAGEALVLTLFGSLWFASLGKGGWVLVFALVGVLAAGTDRGIAAAGSGASLRPLLVSTLFSTTRYVVAGGLLSLLLA